MARTLLSLLLICTSLFPAPGRAQGEPGLEWLAVRTPDKFERTRLVNQGVSIETTVDDMSYGLARPELLPKLRAAGFQITAHQPAANFRALDFPSSDAAFHNYSEQQAAIEELVKKHPGLVHRFAAGTSLQGREITAIRIYSGLEDAEAPGTRPGIVFMGGHHAREHLSVEVPLKLAAYLADNYGKDPVLTSLIDRRDIYILPNINPDGAEQDISEGDYQYWRKNTRVNSGSRCMGVDLNRNYGYGWGTGGSSKDPCSDVFMGPQAFSEPETQAVKRLLESRPNIKLLLSFHTYSELILYPWGHVYDPIGNAEHLQAYKTMAETMARWNGYTPEQSSDLYIASGDTVDWAYGSLGVFGFTFELSPSGSDWGGGGFYPGADAIQPTFLANIKPALYLIDLADNPLRAAKAPSTTLFYGR